MPTIKAVKGWLASELGGMPVNKMQLKSAAQGFLKDGATLAFLNIGGGYWCVIGVASEGSGPEEMSVFGSGFGLGNSERLPLFLWKR